MKEIILPDLGEGMERAVISYWHVEEGDPLDQGDDLVEIMVNNQSINVPCPFSGILSEIFFEEGDEVEEGEVIATLEEKEESFGFQAEEETEFS